MTSDKSYKVENIGILVCNLPRKESCSSRFILGDKQYTAIANPCHKIKTFLFGNTAFFQNFLH